MRGGSGSEGGGGGGSPFLTPIAVTYWVRAPALRPWL